MKEPALPIDALREEILQALPKGPLVVTAPTGAGKSTQVPRWLASLGKVLVVEPRRVACRGLAARVAELERSPLGSTVGYHVRDDRRAGPETRILFATPGVVLRLLARGETKRFAALVLDEFHERRWDTDLILALARREPGPALLVMSATLEGERVARHLEGAHLHAEGRQYPVEIRYLPGRNILPERPGLEERVLAALEKALAGDGGDVLVFLPGKGEIASLASLVSGRRRDVEVLELHGGLTLEAQARVFRPGKRRRVILATNVAETSITVPRITTVIDSGLVRQTRYHFGRGYLTLVPVAADSADQRAGRAGRLGPGRCLRLWSGKARLSPVTPPEIHREPLSELFLAAASCGVDPRELEFLDPPKEYALQDALEELRTLGALDEEARLTERGRVLFGMPLDPPLGNLILEAEKRGCLEDGIDLAAVLSTGRPLFRGGGPPEGIRRRLPEGGCDALALILALREKSRAPEGTDPTALQEARAARRRLRQAWGLPAQGERGDKVDRRNLLAAGLAADPRSAWVARRRRGKIHWAREGAEADLARESTLDPGKARALVAWETRALGEGRKKRILLTQASPVPLSLLAEAGLGTLEVARAFLREGRPAALLRRTFAGRILEEREEEPRGEACRRTVAALFLEGRIFPGRAAEAAERLEVLDLYGRLSRAGLLPPLASIPGDLPGSLETWVLSRLAGLGLERGEDLELLAPEDLLPPALPEPARARLDAAFPRIVKPGGTKYRVEYDVPRREVALVPMAGDPKAPPPLALLPAFKGFRVKVRHHSRVWVLRER